MIGKKLIKRLVVLAITFGLVISGVIYVLGVQGATLFPGQSSRGNVSAANPSGTAQVTQPGNTTYLDISAETLSQHWAGFYGNISGNITLEDANGYVFYDWASLAGASFGEVIASNISSVTWSTINCTNASQMTAINSFLNTTVSDSDRLELTYNTNTHPAFNIGGVSIGANTCNSTNAYSNGVRNTSLFNQVILSNNQSVPIYVTLINTSSKSYKNTSVDFQLLTGVPNYGATLYFFIELG